MSASAWDFQGVPSPPIEDDARGPRSAAPDGDGGTTPDGGRAEPASVAGSDDAVARLRRSEASFRALIESSPEGVVVHRDGLIRYANRAFGRMLGYDDPAELLGKPAMDLVHPDDRAQVVDRLRVLGGDAATVPFAEERLVRRDGSSLVASIAGVWVHFDGEPMIAAIVRDITERRRLDRQMHQSERMASLGALAAGVAHEINNPLTYVILRLDIIASIATRAGRLVARLSGGESGPVGDRDSVELAGLVDELAGHVATAKEGAQRVRTIVSDLRVFAEADRDVSLPVDVHAALDLAAGMAHHQLKQRATLVKRYAPEAFVLGSEGKLAQLFLHLVMNATQAIPPGAPDKHRVTLTTEVQGEHVVIEVADTGGGIPSEHLPRLFEPFFTTKPAGGGAGLGLSMCHGIVTSLGGTIGVETRTAPPTGSTFRVSLPLAPALLPSSPPPPSAPSVGWPPANLSGSATSSRPPGESDAKLGRVLAVHSAPEVRARLEEVLAPFGEVVTLANPDTALAIVKHGAEFDLLLHERSAGDGGLEFGAAVRRECPELADRVLALPVGFGASPAGARQDAPSDVEALRLDVARVLEASRGRGTG